MFMAEYEDEIPEASARDCWQLPGHESSNGPLSGGKIQNRGARSDFRRATCLPEIKNAPSINVIDFTLTDGALSLCRITRFRYTNVLFSPSSASI